jgi:2-hydroxyglutarate dehydrogenase
MYYKPGSMKAKLCVEGAERTYEYCRANHIPFKQVGKLIVAVHEDEVANLRVIYERALENRVVGVAWLDTPEAIHAVEPSCAGLRAVHCSSTGEECQRAVRAAPFSALRCLRLVPWQLY